MLQLRWMRGWIFFCPLGMGSYAMSCTPLQRNILLLNVLSCWWIKKVSWVAISDRKFCFCSTLDQSYWNRYNLNYRPSGSCIFCEIHKQRSLIFRTFFNNSLNLCKNLHQAAEWYIQALLRLHGSLTTRFSK